MTAGIETPRLEARMMFAHVLHCEVDAVYEDCAVTSVQQQKIISLLHRRLNHEPLDKILGHRAFYKDDFLVNENVLSPRPDTEILVEKALEYMHDMPPGKILDLGAGSGCIIISLLKEMPQWCGIAVDVSQKALMVSKANANNLGVDGRLRLVQASWFADDIVEIIGQRFNIIVSNPPYIPTAQIADLEDEVRYYDPINALDGGHDGYAAYRRIAQIAPQLLIAGGFIMLEAGYNQAEQITEIFAKQGLQKVQTAKDLSGINRCVIMQKAVAEREKK